MNYALRLASGFEIRGLIFAPPGPAMSTSAPVITTVHLGAEFQVVETVPREGGWVDVRRIDPNDLEIGYKVVQFGTRICVMRRRNNA